MGVNLFQYKTFGVLELFLGVPFPLMSFNYLWKTLAFSEKKITFAAYIL